jgi:hypothetical protein
VTGHDGQVRWYLLQSGRAVAAVMPGRLSPDAAQIKKLIDLARVTESRSKPGERVAGVFLLDAWFRRYPTERQAVIAIDHTRKI